MELDLAFEHWRQGDVGEVFHREEPLLAETRLHGCVLVALRVAHLVVIVFNLLHQASSLQVFSNLFAHIHAVHAHIQASSLRDGAVGVEDVDGLEVMCLSKGVVVDIVCWSNLQTACSELYVHIAVLDHRDHAVHQRHDNLMAAQPLVLRVLGVDAHGGVAHDGLRTCCGYHSIEASVSILVQHLALAACRHNGVGVGISHIVAQVEQVALLGRSPPL